jgi:guanylate kinase
MKAIDRRGLCLVLAGPSGGGKSTLAHTLLSQEQAIQLSISVTTRPPRPSESEAIDYYFRSEDQFDRLIARDELLEWAQVLGQYRYGTPREPVLQALASGRDMLFDIDWQGFHSLRTALPGDVVGLFLLPPSLGALESRLRARGGDDPAEIARRMERARGEIAHCAEFDHVVVNDNFQQTVAAARAILAAARTATGRLSGLPSTLAALTS